MVKPGFKLRYDSRAWALNQTMFLPAGLVNAKENDSIQCVQSCEDTGRLVHILAGV